MFYHQIALFFSTHYIRRIYVTLKIKSDVFPLNNIKVLMSMKFIFTYSLAVSQLKPLLCMLYNFVSGYLSLNAMRSHAILMAVIPNTPAF
jgi:hypothetical protein